jgi:uncharacterized protein (DUF1684 family)
MFKKFINKRTHYFGIRVIQREKIVNISISLASQKIINSDRIDLFFDEKLNLIKIEKGESFSMKSGNISLGKKFTMPQGLYLWDKKNDYYKLTPQI